MAEPRDECARPNDVGCARIRLSREEAADEMRQRGLLAHVVWVLSKRGPVHALRRVGERLGVVSPRGERTPSLPVRSYPAPQRDDEALGLQPGECVEVKSAEEILETLDEQGRFRGLFFMQEMWQFCGQRLIVMKVLDKLMVESTGTLRTGIKNTVLLSGASCDGSGNGDCAANCYLMWREVWLRRPADVHQPPGSSEAKSSGDSAAAQVSRAPDHE